VTVRFDQNGHVSALTLGSIRRATDTPVKRYRPDDHTDRCICGARLSVFNNDPTCWTCTHSRNEATC
jgi:hypothetical protein